MRPLRAAFVMEQTLGHVTHDRNLRAVVAEQDEVAATWLPIRYDVDGLSRLLPVLRSNWSVRASWRARRALASALARQPHDALLFHTQVTALFSLAQMRRLPTVISLDATPINYDSVGAPYGHHPARQGFLDRQKYHLNRRALHSAAAVVAWSEWVRRSVVDDYGVDPRQVRVLAPGAASAYFDIGGHRPPVIAAHAIDRPQPVRVLFVGGDFERKGGRLLLECWRGGFARECELHIVTHKVIANVPDNVKVHRGLGPNSMELTQLFAEADVFVLPSLGECLAVVLMEATAAGLPVVTTDVGALSEAVIPGESGFVVPAADGRAVHGALEALVSDAHLRERMGRAGHALARRKFDARRNNRDLLGVVKDVAQKYAERKVA